MTYEETIAEHYGYLWRRTRTHFSNYEDRQDLLQQVLMKSYIGWHQFDGENPVGWLKRIMLHQAINMVRKRSRKMDIPQLVHFDLEGLDILGSIDPVEGADETAEHLWLSPELLDALNGMQKDRREAFILYHYEGLSYREIADAMGTPIGTVMSRLSRAKKNLQKELSG